MILLQMILFLALYTGMIAFAGRFDFLRRVTR